MSANPKVKTLRDPAYLLWLRDQPCLFTGVRGSDRESVVACHIGTKGKGIKFDDWGAIPLISSLHNSGHGKGEVSMLRKYVPDDVLRDALRLYARGMYEQYRDNDAQ